MCFAHQNNVRVVALGIPPKEMLLNNTAVDMWISDQIRTAKMRFLDGINIDIEYEIEKDSPYEKALTDFMVRLRDRFHAELPKSQVTFDVPWSPYNEKGNF